MTTLTIIKFFFNIGLVLLGAYAIYREKDLIKFERKVKRYVKAFFKAAYYTVLEKKHKNNAPVEELHNADYSADYEEMLANLNKASKLDDVLVA